jgi:hypothetical protein
VLCIDQDPAQNEAIVRRILMGVAGHRVQGFLAKLGIDRSYVMINAFLYSVYNQGRAAPHINDGAVAGYRNDWFSALLSPGSVEAVISFGSLADAAWREFTKSSDVAAALPYGHVPHPTSPESAGGTPQQIKAATTAMLTKWNSALQSLRQAVHHRMQSVLSFRMVRTSSPKSLWIFRRSMCLPESRHGCVAPMGGRHAWEARPRKSGERYRSRCLPGIPA